VTIGIPDLGTTGQHVLQHLRLAIVAGDYRPGQRVPQEEIADRFGVSVAPVREALQALQQEGQVTYQPRRGYFMTELAVEDLREIYGLRQLLEERAVRLALPTLDAAAIDKIAVAAAECAAAAARGDVTTELEANRRFHFGMLDAAGQTHTMRLIRLLWDSTESYRAMYYNSPVERDLTVAAHDQILDAIRRGDADAVVAELDEHRDRALEVLAQLLRA
jgi:DNA-binding GntR family transcriptional regulator